MCVNIVTEEKSCPLIELDFKEVKMGFKEEHTFAICAYKESPYLEECIKSVIEQSLPSKIIMITSTENEYINELCKKYNIPLTINEGEGGIVQDWNFAYKMANTKYVTIAHQDDVYLPNYTMEMVNHAKQMDDTLIVFSDYAELRKGSVVTHNLLLRIKRFMLWILRWQLFQKSIFARRMILSFGCPICCPSVLFAKENLPEEVFQIGYRSDEDWQAWEKLSKHKGAFVYVDKILTYHRIHEESETSLIIGDNARIQEDYEMFCIFWPKPIAKLLAKFYSSSEKLNLL